MNDRDLLGCKRETRPFVKFKSLNALWTHIELPDQGEQAGLDFF